MRTWIAGRARQFIGAIAEQGHVRPVAAVTLEIARAIDVGDLLQPPDHGRAQDERHGHEGRAAAQRFQPQ